MEIKMRMMTDALNNVFGNVNSERYWDNNIRKLKTWKKRNNIYADLARFIPEGTRSILDVGCSLGDGCLKLKELMPDVEMAGCDFSKVGIDAAKKQSDEIDFFCLDVTKEDIPRDFDCIFMVSILEHLKDYRPVIRKARNHCKTLIVSCPYDEWVSLLGIRPSEHLHSFKKKTLQRYGAKAFVEGKRIVYVIRGKLR